MKRIQKPGRGLRGDVTVPGDKSISHRALMLGAIAEGTTRVAGLLECDDCAVTARAFRDMGVTIEHEGGRMRIDGVGLRGLRVPRGALSIGESGTTMRILPGILAGQSFSARLEAAPSLRRRPMKRIIEPLAAMGVSVASAEGGYPPLTVTGGVVRPVEYRLPVPSAQVKSAVLFAGLYADGTTAVEETHPSRDHTERMMAYFGVPVTRQGGRVSVTGGGALTGRSFSVPGDISGASFFMAAAAVVPGSRLTLRAVSTNPTRAGIIDVLRRMGVSVELRNEKDACEPSADITVTSSPLRGITIEEPSIPAVIDELPIISVLAALATGTTVIRGAGELRVKETDRIASLQEDLRAMGARFTVEGNDLRIDGVPALRGAPVKSFGDHRTCMAMAVAGLRAEGITEIDDTACVAKSFPGFFDMLADLTGEKGER